MVDEQIEGGSESDAQKQYLIEKINDLTDGIGAGYSEALMEELLTRMERTVALFHEEVTQLMESLRTRARERDEKLRTLLEEGGSETDVEKEEEAPVTSAEREMSEWEKKLEARAEKLASTSKSEAEKVQKEGEKSKAGLFGRKKK